MRWHNTWSKDSFPTAVNGGMNIPNHHPLLVCHEIGTPGPNRHRLGKSRRSMMVLRASRMIKAVCKSMRAVCTPFRCTCRLCTRPDDAYCRLTAHTSKHASSWNNERFKQTAAAPLPTLRESQKTAINTWHCIMGHEGYLQVPCKGAQRDMSMMTVSD